jgi:hypothetical protein
MFRLHLLFSFLTSHFVDKLLVEKENKQCKKNLESDIPKDTERCGEIKE